MHTHAHAHGGDNVCARERKAGFVLVQNYPETLRLETQSLSLSFASIRVVQMREEGKKERR